MVNLPLLKVSVCNGFLVLLDQFRAPECWLIFKPNILIASGGCHHRTGRDVAVSDAWRPNSQWVN